jgi:hypothetical protein
MGDPGRFPQKNENDQKIPSTKFKKNGWKPSLQAQV